MGRSSINVQVVSISDEKKEALFKGAIERVRNRRSEAEDVLANMRRLCPATAQLFALKETAISKFPIRMIVPSRAKRPIREYLVVSYSWHHESWSIADDGPPTKPWPFCHAMAEAILEMRISEDGGIWLDQCCINQNDEEEKMAAVGSMDLIHSCARKKLIFLEDVQLSEVEEKLAIRCREFLESEDPTLRYRDK